MAYPEGPSAQKLGTWVRGNSNVRAGFGKLYDHWVLGLVGLVDGCII